MHILYKIDTDPVTYPIDAHQRQRLIPVLSHALCGQVQALHTFMHAYTLHIIQNTLDKRHKVFYITIKDGPN